MNEQTVHIQRLLDSGWDPDIDEHQPLSFARFGWRVYVLEVYCENCGADPNESCNQSTPDVTSFHDCISINGSHMRRFADALYLNSQIEIDLLSESMHCRNPCDIRSPDDTGFLFECADCGAQPSEKCSIFCLPGDKSSDRIYSENRDGSYLILGEEYWIMHPYRIKRGADEDALNGW